MPHHLRIWHIVRAIPCEVTHISERNSFANKILFLVQMAQHHKESRMTLIWQNTLNKEYKQVLLLSVHVRSSSIVQRGAPPVICFVNIGSGCHQCLNTVEMTICSCIVQRCPETQVTICYLIFQHALPGITINLNCCILTDFQQVNTSTLCSSDEMQSHAN